MPPRFTRSMFPINLFPQRVGRASLQQALLKESGFQSICFPSEWGVPTPSPSPTSSSTVSNQFVSPASGEYSPFTFKANRPTVSNQFVSPASGEFRTGMPYIMGDTF